MIVNLSYCSLSCLFIVIYIIAMLLRSYIFFIVNFICSGSWNWCVWNRNSFGNMLRSTCPWCCIQVGWNKQPASHQALWRCFKGLMNSHDVALSLLWETHWGFISGLYSMQKEVLQIIWEGRLSSCGHYDWGKWTAPEGSIFSYFLMIILPRVLDCFPVTLWWTLLIYSAMTILGGQDLLHPNIS